MLRGNKVLLRPEQREDLKRLHELTCNLDLVVLSDGHWQPEPLAQWEKQFYKRLEDAEATRFVIEVDGKLIGGIGLHHRDRRSGSAQFGVGIYDPEYLAHGYGRDAITTLLSWAFEIQNYRRIWLETYALNERAVRSYRAVGFVEDGRLREHAFYAGCYVDVLVMGLLREESRARRGQ